MIRLFLAVLFTQGAQAVIAAAAQFSFANLHAVDLGKPLLMGEAQLFQLAGVLHIKGG
ncbi:hypothetical protein D3C80_2183280 [compost metagenome]